MSTPTRRLPASRAVRPSTTSSCSEHGFTLVEILVSLATGLVLLLAILATQLAASRQTRNQEDTTSRDNEARAAVDIVARDIASAGFLLNAATPPCYARLNYNSGAPTPHYFVTQPVYSIKALTGKALPFVAGGGITLNYPAAATVPSDVLVISAAADGTQYSNTIARPTRAAVSGSFSPDTTGVIPVDSAANLTAGDVGMVQIPVNGYRVCIRVPISLIATSSGLNDFHSTAGSIMPATFYGAFFGKLSTLTGLTGPSTTAAANAILEQAQILDLGVASASNQLTYAYYVDNAGTLPWPTLKKATINSLTDLVVNTSDVAAGVVSLQVLFGIDPGATGNVTSYVTGATLTAGYEYGYVRSVKVLAITQSLYPDNTNYGTAAAPSYYTPPATITPTGGFATYSVPAGSRYRYSTYQTEIAVRNELWAQ